METKMTMTKRVGSLVGLVLLAAFTAACERASEPEAFPPQDRVPASATFDEDAVRAVANAYHQALAAGDSVRAVELLHPEVMIYEGGHAETLGEYRAGHLAADISFAQAVESETTSEEVVDLGGAALYLRESVTRGTCRDREIDSRGTETLVMVPQGDTWVIRHIHWSATR
jgi:hypothetical protein